MSHDRTVQDLAPPLAALHTGDETATAPPVVVRLRPHGVLRGRMLRFDSAGGVVHVSPDDGGEPRTVGFDALKMLNTVMPSGWTPARAPDRGDVQGPAAEFAEREYRIEFEDGDSAAGRTRGFREDATGLTLYPSTSDGRLGFLFVPRAALREHRIGPLIGQALVDSGHVDERSIEAAVASQQQVRQALLGTRLHEDGLLTKSELEHALDGQKSTPYRRLGEILLEGDLITRPQLEQALVAQRGERLKPLGEILVAMGAVSRAQVQEALAEKLGIPRVDLRHFYADPDAVRLVPEDVARNARAVPLYEFRNRLVVAIDDPLDWQRLEQVAFAAKRKVDPVLADGEEIVRAIDLLYTGWEAEDEAQEAHRAEVASRDDKEAGIADNVVVSMVNRVILNAWHEKASDIHIEAGGALAPTVVRIRRDGILRPFLEIRPGIRRALVARLKVMAGLDTTARREPQDGRIDMRRFSKRELELRIAVLPTVGDEEDVVMRILSAAEPVPLARLGLSAHNRTRLDGVLARPHGLLLVCGPTGSGKTTTLHALLGALKSNERKIWTAEDPVEIVQKGVRQVQVNTAVGLTFAKAMRAFLRADPDIVMIGEMRDRETAGVAVEAALTGHLVLSTLHTNSAPETVSRLLDLGLNPFNFADSLVAVLSQRLVRTLCPECRRPAVEAHALVEEMLEEFRLEQGEAAGDAAAPDTPRERHAVHDAVGCRACAGTGYAGRLALHELLVADRALRRLVQRGEPPEVLRTAAMRGGMRTLKQDGIEKVLEGLTDVHEMRRACA